MTDSQSRNLKDYSLFNSLSDKELKLIENIGEEREVTAGSIIINEGDIGEDLYLLEEGVVDIYKTLTIVTSKNEFGTKERSFVRLTGDEHCYFVEMALFGSGERSATVRAVTKCQLIVIKNSDFRKLCENEPRIGYIVVTNIALMLAQYLRKTNEDVIKLTTALSLALSAEK
ncbi:MAG TPA: cyclic nucleotide-binding domain-containing protein [Anaerolineae bacterium]|nr:cyclic nucleotide-binding domain-containing protein [Anaerolineae bacterium]